MSGIKSSSLKSGLFSWLDNASLADIYEGGGVKDAVVDVPPSTTQTLSNHALQAESSSTTHVAVTESQPLRASITAPGYLMHANPKNSAMKRMVVRLPSSIICLQIFRPSDSRLLTTPSTWRLIIQCSRQCIVYNQCFKCSINEAT